MKPFRIRKVLLLTLTVSIVCITSCEDLLDRKPYDGLIKSEFWQNEDDVRAAVMGCYDQLQELLGNYIMWGEGRSDLIEVKKDNQKIDLNKQIVSQYNGLTNWKPFYVAINRANTVIENAPGAQEIDENFTEDELQAYIGECLFIRSLCYFYLVRTFKEVPLITASYATDDQEYYYPKSTSAEIYQQIIEDLETAEPDIPESYGNPVEDHGRGTKGSVNALLADVCLWMGLEDPTYYELSVEAADRVIASGIYQFVEPSSWFSIFFPGNSSESIFELQFDAALLERNDMVDWFSTEGETPTYQVRTNPQTSKVEFWLEDLAVEDANRGKMRSYATVSNDNIVWKYSGSGSSVTNRRQVDFSDCHWIFYRLAEVHLMKAEALNQMGNREAGAAEVNILRQIRELPPLDQSISGENLDLEILRERKRELAFEGKRWYDLMRYSRIHGPDFLVNRIYKAWDDIEISQRIVNPESWYLPIFFEELRINKSLVQNPYYAYQ